MGTFESYDGTTLAYRAVGEGEPLICLPGGAMRASAYLGDLGGLSAHRRLVLLDLRGTGGSAVPADPATYRCERLVADVEALRVHLGLERVDLLAHSAAGNLGMLYAAAHPHRVRRLALVTPTAWAAGVPVTPEDRLKAARLREDEPWFDEAYAALDAQLRGVTGGPGSAYPFLYGRWDAAARAHAAQSPRQVNAAAAQVFVAESTFDPPATRAALAAFAAPVLVLAGERDGVPTSERAAEIAALFPDAELAVQPGGGHFPWLDDPGGFSRTVGAFFDDGLRSVRANGVRIAYRTWGDPAAPPVVLLHGRSGNSAHWTHVARRLARTRRVYAPDLRGHGMSDWPGSYTYLRMRDDVRGFLDALGLGRADLVGHSMGGVVALLVAQAYPERVGRLVLEDPPAPFPAEPRRPAPVRTDERLDFDREVVAATDAQYNDPDPGWAEGLSHISSPTLLLAGGPSSHLPQGPLARMAELIPGCRLVTIDAGHLIHENAPEAFLAELKAAGCC
ncbi:hydrolase [Streptomyces agglomeratus]|uniref:Hydrolase n=1 Tax=Streptomyces agglomeratus TaxID=285458 RepID=A0A1E5PFP6_9ACTN|nr:alpha/beta hydrolase [Streptomyces agglomeratus]OEJ28363.1 hydrolase [Streptomyces agglomeratus]